MPRIAPNLWFDTEALEAAERYVAIFPRSQVLQVQHYTEGGHGEPGSVMTVAYELDGQPFVNINGGPQFPFTEATSLEVRCADQAEVDHYWEALTADGGQEVQCGWLKDRYGYSWQIVPEGLTDLLADPDPERVARATAAVLGMIKLDLAAIQAAADGS